MRPWGEKFAAPFVKAIEGTFAGTVAGMFDGTFAATFGGTFAGTFAGMFGGTFNGMFAGTFAAPSAKMSKKTGLVGCPIGVCPRASSTLVWGISARLST